MRSGGWPSRACPHLVPTARFPMHSRRPATRTLRPCPAGNPRVCRAFEHNGWVATLEDWFDERRLLDDDVPTWFRGYGVKTRPVPGHEFGLKLSPPDKKALIAFLKTL